MSDRKPAALASVFFMIGAVNSALGGWLPGVSEPAELNTNAGSDSGDDKRPQVTADGLDSWVAVWQSDDDLAGAWADRSPRPQP